MTATKKKPDAFGSLLAAFQALYEEEINRLVEVYRPRILAGEFSGNEDVNGGTGNGGPKHLRLADELQKTHPWLKTQPGRFAVASASRWSAEADFDGYEDASVVAAECMSHDILDTAAARGWVKRWRDGMAPDPYALRVA